MSIALVTHGRYSDPTFSTSEVVVQDGIDVTVEPIGDLEVELEAIQDLFVTVCLC